MAKEQETLESLIKYCKDLVQSIKSRQSIESSQLELKNNWGTGGGTNWDFQLYLAGGMGNTSKKIKVIFTPQNIQIPFSSLECDYAFVDNTGSPSMNLSFTLHNSISTNMNAIEWILVTPNQYVGTVYIKCNIKSVDSGTVSYQVL